MSSRPFRKETDSGESPRPLQAEGDVCLVMIAFYLLIITTLKVFSEFIYEFVVVFLMINCFLFSLHNPRQNDRSVYWAGFTLSRISTNISSVDVVFLSSRCQLPEGVPGNPQRLQGKAQHPSSDLQQRAERCSSGMGRSPAGNRDPGTQHDKRRRERLHHVQLFKHLTDRCIKKTLPLLFFHPFIKSLFCPV